MAQRASDEGGRTRGRGGARAPRWARKLGLEPRRAVAVVVAVLLCVLGAVGLWRLATPSRLVVERAEAEARDPEVGEEAQAEEPTQAEPGEDEQPTAIQVHVDGAVASPGLYVLTLADARVNDAVLAAGGLTEEADTTALNLAEPLSDGCKVHVPKEGEEAVAVQSSTSGTGESTDTGAFGGLVNINTAGIEELCTLSGVGEATARAIIEDREANGPFASKEDLMRVSGIGEKKFAKVEADICV